MNISKTKTLIRIFCAQNNLRAYDLAQILKIAPQNLSRKVNAGTLRTEDLLNLLDKLGFEIKIKKKE